MSRGHGSVQRRILDLFKEQPEKLLDTVTIACALKGRDSCTVSEHSSAARALRKLVREGRLVDMGRGFRGGRRMFAMPDAARAYQDRVQRTFGKSANVTRPLS